MRLIFSLLRYLLHLILHCNNNYLDQSPLEWVQSPAYCGGRDGGGAHIWLAATRPTRLYPGDDVTTPVGGRLTENPTRNLKRRSSSP